MSTVGWRALAVVLALALGGIAATSAAQQATPVPGGTKSVEWTRYDVTLDLGLDGVLRVAERQALAFHGGEFTNGFADLPLRRVDGIERVRVSEEAGGRITPYEEIDPDSAVGRPGTFAVQTDADGVHVTYWFTPTRDASRTFVLEYEALGAVRTTIEDGIREGEIWWTAVGEEVTEAGPVRAATALLRLPVAVDPARVLVNPVGYVPPETEDWSVWTWRRTPLPPGEDLTVRLRFPADVLPAPAGTPATVGGA